MKRRETVHIRLRFVETGSSNESAALFAIVNEMSVMVGEIAF